VAERRAVENQGRRPRWSTSGDVAKWRVRRRLQTGGGVLDAQRQLTWQRGGQEQTGGGGSTSSDVAEQRVRAVGGKGGVHVV